MNPYISMQTHAENYLSERRQLGYGLRTTGYSVISFARYIDTLKPRTADCRNYGRLGPARPG